MPPARFWPFAAAFFALLVFVAADAHAQDAPAPDPPAQAPAAADASAPDAPAKNYEIKLVRPPQVGQKYALTAEGAVVRTATYKVDGQPVGTNEDGYGVRLEGTVEVLAVNDDGEEGKAACTVAKCVRITKEGEQELVPAGRVLTAEGGKEDTTFTVDQGELSPDATEALELVFRMGEADGYNDDKIYGTAARQPVGGSWPLDPRAAAAEAAADGVTFEPADISGSLAVEKVEKVGDAECLRIGGQTTIKKFAAAAPENMTFESGSLKAKYSGLFPVDTGIGTLAEQMSVTHTATFRGKNTEGKDVVVDSKAQRASEMTRKFLTE